MPIFNGRNLTFKQLDTMFIAKYVRDAMEDFHCKNLSDDQMKELNQIIRQAIYDGQELLRIGLSDDASGVKSAYSRAVQFGFMSIPDYWEPPKKDNLKKELGLC